MCCLQPHTTPLLFAAQTSTMSPDVLGRRRRRYDSSPYKPFEKWARVPPLFLTCFSMAESNQGEVTRILLAARDGDSDVAAELLPLVYGELRQLARAYMAGGGANTI